MLHGYQAGVLLDKSLDLPGAAEVAWGDGHRRGTGRPRAAGAGPRPRLTNPDRILATVLYLRRLCTQAVLGDLFAVDRSRVTEAIRETRPLLEEHGHAITPATARFPAPADLIAFLAAEDAGSATQTKPACQ